MAVPDRIPIIHDEYHAKWMGKLADGRQFFATTPFVGRGGKDPGCEFIAIFFFSENGEFVEAKIDNLGPRADLDEPKASKLFDQRIEELGTYELADIRIAPFATERYGVEFGFIIREREDDDDIDVVELQPGNYMAFFEPWNGYYDT